MKATSCQFFSTFSIFFKYLLKSFWRMTTAGSRTVIPKQGGKTPLLTERHSAVPLCKGRRGHLRIIPIHYINPFLFTVRQSVRHFANAGTLPMRRGSF